MTRERLDARLEYSIRRAHRRNTALHRNPVSAGISPEIVIERTILLHDHDDMLDLVDPNDVAIARPGRPARRKSYDRNRKDGRHAAVTSQEMTHDETLPC